MQHNVCSVLPSNSLLKTPPRSQSPEKDFLPVLGSGWTDLTVWSPVLVRSLKIGKSNGYIYMDNIVY